MGRQLLLRSATGISVLPCLALRTTLWNVGIFHQILWSLSHGLGFHSTISGAGNFLEDHFSPSLVTLVPFFYLSDGNPLTLPIVHTVLIYGGASAWLFLASKVRGVEKSVRENLTRAVLVFILSFESLWKNIGWGFHDECSGIF